MSRFLALLAVVALLSVPTTPAEAGFSGGVMITPKTDGSVDIAVPSVGNQRTLTKFSPSGSQNIPLPTTLPAIVNDPAPGAWACYFFDSVIPFPALCVIPNPPSSTGGVDFIRFIGGSPTNPFYGGNRVSISWESNPPGADGSIVWGTNSTLARLDSTSRFWSTSPVTGVACYIVAAMRQGQVQGLSDVVCVVPHPEAVGAATQLGTALTVLPTPGPIPSPVRPMPTPVTRPPRQSVPTPIAKS